MDKSQIKSQS